MNVHIKNLVTMVNNRLLELSREGKTIDEIESGELFNFITYYLLNENMYHGYNYYIYDEDNILRLAGNKETNIVQFEVRQKVENYMKVPTLEEYKELYNKVFDINGNVKVCGRATTSKLITASKYMDIERNYPDFGDELTGLMNISNFTSLHKKLVK